MTNISGLLPPDNGLKVKQSNHNSFPRTSAPDIAGTPLPRGLSLASLDLPTSQDTEKIKEILAAEMGVSTLAVFDDIKGVVTKLSNKIATAESASANSSVVISKLLAKLVSGSILFFFLLIIHRPD